jgi:hypothetical protein
MYRKAARIDLNLRAEERIRVSQLLQETTRMRMCERKVRRETGSGEDIRKGKRKEG